MSDKDIELPNESGKVDARLRLAKGQADWRAGKSTAPQTYDEWGALVNEMTADDARTKAAQTKQRLASAVSGIDTKK